MKKPYVGKGDVFDYGNQKSFVGEHATNREFAFELTNTSSVDKIIAISPAVTSGMSPKAIAKKIAGIDGYVTKDGLVEDVDGEDLDGLPDNGEGTTGAIKCNSLDAENPIDYALLYASVNPFRIVNLELQSNQKSQFSTKIEQRTLNPFSSSNAEMNINLRSFVGADQYQEDRVEIPLLKENRVLTC